MIWLVHFPKSSITRMGRGGEERGGEGRGGEGRGGGGGGGESTDHSECFQTTKQILIKMYNGGIITRLTPCKAGELHMF